MDQMDDFLASLPDEEPPHPLTQGAPPPHNATPIRARSPPHAHSHHPPHSTHADPLKPAPAVHSMRTDSRQCLQTRRDSHASATSSSIQPASSLDTTLPALHPHPHPHLPFNPAEASAAHAAAHNAAILDRKQAQQQSALQLPCITPLPPPSVASDSSASFTLPPVCPNPTDASSSAVDATVQSVESIAAAAAAAGVRGSPSEARSARVSRASSSVRSEQSVGSLSPEKAAVKEQRHKVKVHSPMRSGVQDVLVTFSMRRGLQQKSKIKKKEEAEKSALWVCSCCLHMQLPSHKHSQASLRDL